MVGTVYKSPSLLALRVICLELLAEALYLIVTLGGQWILQTLGYEVRLLSLGTQLAIVPLQIGILVATLVKWQSETYEIRESEVVIKQGVLNKSERAYPYNNIQSVTVKQSVLERLFNAGSISVYVPTLGSDLVFVEIPSPQHFADRIKQALPYPSKGQFIVRR